MFCPSCGSQNPQDVHFCLSCGAALPSAPPLATAPAPATEPAPPRAEGAQPPANDTAIAGYRVASLGDRFIAVVLDTLLLGAVFAVVGMWAAIRFGGVTESGFHMTGKPALLAMGAVLIIGFTYYWFLEAVAGATIGKGIVGVRVCNQEGRRCGFGASLIRNILRLIDGLAVYLVGFFIALFSRRRQRLGDHLAHTYVVEKRTGTLARVVLVLLWLALLAGGVLGAVVLHRQAPASAIMTAQEAGAAGGGIAVTSGGKLSFPPVLTSGDLKLVNFRFTEKEDGPPRFPAPYKHRDRVRAEWELTGYTTDAQGQVHVKYRIAVTDPNGISLYGVQKEVNQAIRVVKPVSMYFWFDVPVFAPPGTYRVQVNVHDDVKNTDGELTAGFLVQAEPLPISTQLEIRDFYLTLSEDGAPLSPAVVPPGTTVYVSGKVAGMKFREDEIDLQLGFQVFGPDGEKLLDKPDFLNIKDSFPYHPPTFFVRISAHLRLPSDVPKGGYTERYTLTDRIGGTSRDYELKFEVR